VASRYPFPGPSYRLQLRPEFGFQEATQLLPYLAELGIATVYTSPYLQATPGSTHGYDLVRHDQINRELGGEAGLDNFAQSLAELGLNHVLDMVPNHMGIASSENLWWNDVLENGPSALHADFFDIEWSPRKEAMRGKVLLPILGDQYGKVLEGGEFRLIRDGGTFALAYYQRVLPLAPRSLAPLLQGVLESYRSAQANVPNEESVTELESILTAIRHLPGPEAASEEERSERNREKEVIKRRLAELFQRDPEMAEAADQELRAMGGVAGEPASFNALDDLLRAQSYRPAFWKVATEEINYRRFFDINDLAALRMDRPEVLRATHQLVMEQVAAGRIQGLRLDHTDGLYDPLGYFQNLVLWHSELAGKGSLALWAEKILEPGEKLPESWPVLGTTGYDFLSSINGLWVDPSARSSLTAFTSRQTGERGSYADLLYNNKRLIMQTSLSSEVNTLALQLERLAESNRRSRDFTLVSLTAAIVETIAAFAVYRTYLRPGEIPSEQDRSYVQSAVRLAKRRNPGIGREVLDFLQDTLLQVIPDNASPEQQEDQLRFALRFQQISSPVMAKAAEDTTFYTYPRLTSLNEVGSDPSVFGTSPEQFHTANAERLARWPDSMLAVATHDTKRGADTRIRISAISEAPKAWTQAVRKLNRLTSWLRVDADGVLAPTRADELLFYQAALGIWPLDGQFGDFTQRLQAYMTKATKEAKRQTSWINPNPAYDQAVTEFVAKALANPKVLEVFAELDRQIAVSAACHGLSQALLQLSCPGVPDLYQGGELWDQNLVDPDNRRPVDYARRRELLARLSAEPAGPEQLNRLLREYRSGEIKLYLIQKALQCRRRHPQLFARGNYRALEIHPHLISFQRKRGQKQVIVCAPRLVYGLSGGEWPLGELWGEARLQLPTGRFHNLLTGESWEGSVALAELLAHFPAALLEAAQP
jgi:(1->4)-alpha-D-glucan 1-alpha-D-glucosylmutase